MNHLNETPLGKTSEYVDQYTPSLLFPVPRQAARETLALEPGALPFHGVDVWNAYELSWLNGKGKPVVAMAELTVPCTSPNIIESKSLKLYLNSCANTRFAGPQEVRAALEQELTRVAGAPVAVRLFDLQEAARLPLWQEQGLLVDTLDVAIEDFQYNADWLSCEQGGEQSAVLVSHLLRSRCPVTDQPDWGSVQVCYTGAPIDPAGFLRYLVSLRNHQGFHEQVIERLFVDIQRRCAPRHLSVYGRFTRRGGLDINPFRCDREEAPANRRTVRQ